MNDADLGNMVHDHLARLGNRLASTSATVEGAYGPRDYVSYCLTSELPKARQTYAFSVLVGWAVLVCVGIGGTLVFGYLADSVGGESATRVVVAIWTAGTMFCAAGMFNAMWRAFWFTWKAQRRARRHGTADERFARAMRGILPRNSSLIGQSVVGLLTLVIVLV
jgi:nicotinamide riboside transporter PnuC